MAKFEVYIPALDAAASDATFKVEADNWMAALKAGLLKLGEQGNVVQNVMVDIQDDNSVHVTEARSGRVFRIRELSDEEAARAAVKRPSQARMPAVRIDEMAKTISGPLPGSTPDTQKTVIGLDVSEVKTEPPGPAANFPPPPVRHKAVSNKSSPRIQVSSIEELEAPTKPISGVIGRPRSSPERQRELKQQIEDTLADLFERVQQINSYKTDEEALYFILDMALEKVPADAGSILKADAGSGDLTFLVARGPKAADLLRSKIVVPAGQGIAGFCSAEGVSVAISDVQKDPRFYSGVGEKVDYETKSLACAPMMSHGRSFGCLQLLNRKAGPSFLEHEIGILSYLSHQVALFMNNKE
ncbi:MAG: GAF domain-containing protein [Myxococcaceae bacterium]|nr:GAF domain-containing protein [Myxococcaceae bacterium]